MHTASVTISVAMQEPIVHARRTAAARADDVTPKMMRTPSEQARCVQSTAPRSDAARAAIVIALGSAIR